MRAFIERVFKSRKLKKEQEDVAKEIPSKIEAIIEEVKKEIKKKSMLIVNVKNA